MEPYVFELPAQMIIYGGDEPVILDGVAEDDETGDTTITVPVMRTCRRRAVRFRSSSSLTRTLRLS